MSDLLTVVCDRHKVVEALGSPGKGRNAPKVRGILALLVSENDHLTLEDLGRLVNRGPSGLSRQVKRLAVDCQKSKEIKSEILSTKSNSNVRMSGLTPITRYNAHDTLDASSRDENTMFQ